MDLPEKTQRPACFVIAKQILVIAIATTPVTFFVAAIMQSLDALYFAIACVLAIPFMGVSGYWMCLFLYSGLQAVRNENLEDGILASKPYPLQVFIQMVRQSQRADAAIASVLVNIFVVIWSAGLLLFVIGVIVSGLLGELRA